jgi:hypothetical protein
MSKQGILLNILFSDSFAKTTGLDFPQILKQTLESGQVYQGDSSFDLLCRHNLNLLIEQELFRNLPNISDRHFEGYSFLESVISTSLNLFHFQAKLPVLDHLKYSLFSCAKTLFNERFQTFSIIQINEFSFSPAKLRLFWQFETVFSLLMHLCRVSPVCSAKVIMLYFEHFDLLFKFFEDVFLLLNFQKVKQFEIKKEPKPTKSGFGGFFKSVRSMLTQDAQVESENEIFIRQKLRGNITAKNKNSHLLRNFISTLATSLTSFKSLLDGLQFVLFGVANRDLAQEICYGLDLHSKKFVTFLSMDFFGNGNLLKGMCCYGFFILLWL